jgi:hypothetical protein
VDGRFSKVRPDDAREVDGTQAALANDVAADARLRLAQHEQPVAAVANDDVVDCRVADAFLRAVPAEADAGARVRAGDVVAEEVVVAASGEARAFRVAPFDPDELVCVGNGEGAQGDLVVADLDLPA